MAGSATSRPASLQRWRIIPWQRRSPWTAQGIADQG
jgi:hypothetical protein